MIADNERMREAFEAGMQREGCDEDTLRWTGDEYLYSNIQDLWQGFQAGAAWQAAQPVSVGEVDEAKPSEWHSPSCFDLITPEFNAIWNTIKTWDVNVPEQYSGYCGANGNHVMAILDAIRPYLRQQQPQPVSVGGPGPDYFYNVDDWETTHHDESEVLNELDYIKNGILRLGRLVELPSKFVIRIWNEDEDSYEHKYFDTREEAETALTAIQKGTGHDE